MKNDDKLSNLSTSNKEVDAVQALAVELVMKKKDNASTTVNVDDAKTLDRTNSTVLDDDPILSYASKKITTMAGGGDDIRGYYSSLLQNRLRRDASILHPLIPLPPHVIGGIRDQLDRSKVCNCKRSHCLKLYCECFAAGIYCSTLCNCVKCKNCAEFEEERAVQIMNTLERNGSAFRPRASACAATASSCSTLLSSTTPPATPAQQLSSTSQYHITQPSSIPFSSCYNHRGCNCRKSFCLKKYCECFQNLLFCNPQLCKCISCHNVEGNLEREELVRKRRTQQELAAAQALTYQALKHGRTSTTMDGIAVTPHSNNHMGGYNYPPSMSSSDVFVPPSMHTVPAFGGYFSSLLAFGMGTTTSPAASESTNINTSSGFSPYGITTSSNFMQQPAATTTQTASFPHSNANTSTVATSSKIDDSIPSSTCHSSSTSNKGEQSSATTSKSTGPKTSLEKKWDKATEDVKTYFQEINSLNNNYSSPSQDDQSSTSDKRIQNQEQAPSKKMCFSPASALQFTKKTIGTIVQEMDHVEKYYELQQQPLEHDTSTSTTTIQIKSPVIEDRANNKSAELSSQNNSNNDDETISLFICSEELKEDNKSLLQQSDLKKDNHNSKNSINSKEMSILCTQDTVLMNHLARTINNIAMEVGKLRRKRKRFST